ncbi:polysaccharide pyruvyl transferase family protein [Fibrobacter sp.]|uniref:polysaccharide pyruvyl transferase family protein n=1 Tax=Fibrobacter sp. TaxID=35828 RepID=UPI0025C58B84|nr:polysaccharide pyruvyl transferase family protein [Fibrobacter sp.]MBR3073397.1 polysaccharide pyruvyl transferase family protein [Fibrobacter sp.]
MLAKTYNIFRRLASFLKRIVRMLRYILREICLAYKGNSIIASYLDIPAKKNQVNIYQYHPKRFGYDLYQNKPYNLGDSLGEVIVEYFLKQKGIDINAKVSSTKHLYCVGSNIQGGYQDATIWGSGMFPFETKALYQKGLNIPGFSHIIFLLQKISRRKLDIRAVRGPLTKKVLEDYGFKCPGVFGDPAILMPLIYNPDVKKDKRRLIIPQFVYERQFRTNHPNENIVSMNTNDYKSVIDEIVSSEIVYTSSLHGIILAESYGVPAVFFRCLPKFTDFKYLDYYYSTGRTNIKIAESFEEALTMDPLPLPDLSGLRKGLLESFPYDLWEK